MMAWPWLSCLLLLTLVVSVTANTAPVFLGNMSRVNLPEDLPVGAEAFWLVAQDQDNDTLTYGISGPDASVFSVTPTTGEVKLANPLDYETAYLLHIIISVTDHHNKPVQRPMQVIVEDRNDNAPVFQNTGFSTSINETLPVGSLVFSVLAKDPDTGSAGVVVYSIEKVIPSTEESQHLFKILPNGSIILNGSLSYNNKSAFYQLELKASDSGGIYNNTFIIRNSSHVFLFISVVDEPDLDPQFVREIYSASVAENAPQGESVLKVEAVDSDKGINDPVTYSISNSTMPGWFDIGPDGVIRVTGSLDREQLLEEDEEVKVQVTATEMHPNIYGQNATVSTWVTLMVTDVNDHKPEFYNCSLPACTFSPQEAQVNFTGYVDEHASTRIPIDSLTMVVYDPDKGNNGTFLLSVGGPDAEAFSVSPDRAAGSTDVQVLVRAPELVDYEDKTVMLVQVVATDSVSGNASIALVTIHLRDINDHRPTFPYSFYNLSIWEHSADGTVVTDSIHAFDPDTGEGGRITYSLLPGNGADIFEVDQGSGTVTVRNGEALDREKQAEYYLTLQATDGGNLSASTTLHIVLLDINDNRPVVSGSYNIFVQEEEGDVFVTIQARDDDQPHNNNSRLHFSLLPGAYSHNFSVDPGKGILRNLGPLDREAIEPALGGRIVLTVLVSDCGKPVLSTEVNVTINVEDINDNLPIFNQSVYSFSVKERDRGELVGVVTAWDADQTEANNRISFLLSGSGANNFVLRGLVLGSGWAEGRLWLPSDVSLDYETQASYNLTVSAENPDPHGREATAGVSVAVEDVNDEPPTLDPASLQGIRVSENGSQHGLVAQVVAWDVDTLSQLEIQLVNVICTKAGVNVGSLCRGWFSVLANGSVFISQSEAIDYESCDLVTLVVRAWDITTDPRFLAHSDNGSLAITIEDMNDNAPYFLPENKTFVIIPELVVPNQQVASVQARDNDSGNNGAILFSILQVDFIAKDGATTPFQGYFRVTTTLEADMFIGNIELVTNLDSTLQGTYQVTVQAQDKPSVGPAQEAKITLNLFTVDQSYRVRLQFSMNKEEVGANMEKIITVLTQATRTTVYVVSIQDMESTARARGRSYLDAYFVFSNGTALTLDELSVMIRNDQDSLMQLLQLGLVVLGSQESQESDLPKLLVSVITGLGVALLLVIVIMTTALVCIRKSYHRKLRAVKAAKEAQKTAAGVMPLASAIPGTNMYTTERANPMLDLPTKDLNFNSQSSSSDLDHMSLNSLDDNSVDLEKDKEIIKALRSPEPLMGPNPCFSTGSLRLEKEALHSPMELDTEPLGMVLSGRKTDRGGQQELSFTNAGLDTTDL
ncbi:cadherin-related family member 2 [Mustela putorius furo]|uniref:Cadherin-related family member 2 n=1 Tax=Mustela putorius furo TaxID=9669 RepID=A0A8U0MDT4_MUSPF|nr:cadherin-related family member 2 [Mustela putorius furo]XP_004737589.1 cadherin-related family member 2 [Mustela putorius furo]XP_004737591.1 cadherin-related family member 2 [Mustela putorius furo]XP_004737592.1 cadherin-related family member 2 [Mustela putorius furo]XP_004737597.1 cadherin-related family member 2 [Mustela putorius furo]